MTTEEQERHLLEENRALLLWLLEESNSVKFQKLLYERPKCIQMRCIADDKVCFSLILLIFVSCKFVP